MHITTQCSYIIGVDVPGHIAIGDQLPVDIATDLGVSPAIVDVDDADHIPLKRTETNSERDLMIAPNKSFPTKTLKRKKKLILFVVPRAHSTSCSCFIDVL